MGELHFVHCCEFLQVRQLFIIFIHLSHCLVSAINPESSAHLVHSVSEEHSMQFFREIEQEMQEWWSLDV